MNRRGFLLGSLTAAVGAGVAVLQATPTEIAAYGHPLVGPVTVHPLTDTADATWDPPGMLVYDKNGRPLGCVTEMVTQVERYEVSSWDNPYASYGPGLMTTRYTVIGMGRPRT